MMEVRTSVEAEPVSKATAVLGEGPYWVPEDSALLWVDIPNGQLFRTEFPSGATQSMSLGAVSAAFPALGGGILTAGDNRLMLHTPPAAAGDTWVSLTIAEVPAREGIRFNDASVDPAGRIWVGSMHIAESEPLGTLYRLDPGRVLTPVLKGVTVSNGIGWSPDGSRMYYADSPLRQIDVFDYDPATGEAFQRRTFADLSRVEGIPDGLTVDLDGCIWVALWGGGALRRFTPDGEQDAVIPLPVSRPTSCAFGGPDLTDLFVTTASIDLTDDQLAAEPLAGRLLRLHPGPSGLPSTSAWASIPS
jgi:sugar lactone lactonase YvrE